MESVRNINAVESFVFKRSGKFAGIDWIAFIYFFFVGSRYIGGIGDDAVNVDLPENLQRPEAAETGLIDDMVNAVGIMFLEATSSRGARFIEKVLSSKPSRRMVTFQFFR